MKRIQHVLLLLYMYAFLLGYGAAFQQSISGRHHQLAGMIRLVATHNPHHASTISIGGTSKRGLVLSASRSSSSNSSSENNDINADGGRSRSKRQAVASSARRFGAVCKLWMHKVLVWQRQKRRSLLTAAALSLSVLFASQHLYSEQQHQHQQLLYSQQATPQVTVMPQRGGAAAGTKATTSAAPSLNQATSLFKREQGALNKMEEGVTIAGRETSRTLREAILDLGRYMKGPKSDTLFLLLATALITPLCKRLGTSPILGFLAAGMLLGPNGYGIISGIHTTETLAELGIVFFLFEMGIELSVERLMSMRKDVFGLGFSQFVVTALALAGVGGLAGLPGNALVVLGGGLALSSSAFVLQLLKDKKQLATRFGKAAFGVLLFQDLAVVPLLVVTPILAGGGGGLAAALFDAVVKAAIAFGSIAVAGRFALNPLFRTVAQAQSQEAFLAVILLTVLSMSFMTEGLGLSNTLGAFLAGVLLSETKYRFQVEADIAPFRGMLLGLFFVTVGFEIDVGLIATNLPLVASVVVGILAIKALVLTALSLMFGLSMSTSQQTGLILSQGGEFAFVAFGLARSLGILDASTTKLLLTSVSLTMAATPAMSALGGKISKALEEKSDFSHYLGQDRDANEIKESDDFAVVVGYGKVGKVVCDLLDRKFIKYEGIEIDPNKAIQARNAGLPIFYGDIGRQEVAEAFNVGKAKAVIVCIADRQAATRAVIALRRWYPDLKIFARAADADHASRLQNTLNVAAMVPILPEDNLLLTLPFGGAVMKALGVPSEEVNAIVEGRRKEILSGKGLEEDEEEVELLQLGISPASNVTDTSVDKKKKTTSDSTETSDKATDTTDGEPALAGSDKSPKERTSAIKEAAAERLEEAREKSPFVAQVIEEVCPDSADSEKEALPENEEVVIDVAASDAEDPSATSVDKNDPTAFQ